MSLPRGATALFLLAGLPASSIANASEDPLILEWHAPHGCAEADVHSEIGLIVLDAARSAEAAEETVAEIAPEAMESASSTNGPHDSSAISVGAPDATPSSDRALLSSVSAPRNERSWRFFLSPRLAFDKGSLPGAGFGVGGQLGSTFGAQRLSLGFLVWPALGASLEPSPPTGARFSLLVSTLEDCLRLSRGAYALDLCGGIEVGRIHAEGGSDTSPDTTASLWLGPEGGVAASWKLGDRLRLRGALGSVVPLLRPEFRFRETGGETVHRTSWVAMRSSIEIELNY